MSFEIIATDEAASTGRRTARAGKITLAHGSVDTPAFMPVGTVGTVKTLSPEELKKTGTQILLGNTYHLYLRPGLEVLEKFGGLHRFMHWEGPILSDSGGFQVFSLAKLQKISDEGVLFQSHLNGNSIFLTPELSARIQQAIGSDIAMVLDECLALPNTKQALETAVIRSVKWAKRFLAVPRPVTQQIFGIVQGGCDFDLREQSLDQTAALPLDGIAIGGLSVGEPHLAMCEVLEFLAPRLPASLPHYLMGVGTPKDLLEGIRFGIDLFDCVLPTRNARNGGFFTNAGLLNIRNEKYTQEERPIEEGCQCECCRHYSRAYLRHLFQAKEILGLRLATHHNLHYYHRFMSEIRQHITIGTFSDYYREHAPKFKASYSASGSASGSAFGAEKVDRFTKETP